jgi:hypothetical protein
MFDFENLEQQYEMTEKWAQTHNPILLSDFLKN